MTTSHSSHPTPHSLETAARQLPDSGTLYQWIDPSGEGKNWACAWGLVDVWQRLWIYREWPCPKIAVPGIGLPGVWAEPGKDKRHSHGGVPGPGSKNFGFGLRHYKGEFARLEGWDDAQSDQPIEDWKCENGAREPIYLRYFDKRFGNTKHKRANGETTLQDEMGVLGMRYELITGHGSQDGRTAIEHGTDLINDALSFDDGWEEMDIMGRVRHGPKLFISEDCVNIWFALENYTAMGGYTEATKDWIDILRYALHSNPCYVQDFRASAPRGYGQRASSLKQQGPVSKEAKFAKNRAGR